MRQLFTALLAPLGTGTAALAWRIAGASMVLHWLQELRDKPVLEFVGAWPPALHLIGLGGLGLIARGPRAGLLLILAAAWSWQCYAVPAGRAGPMVKVYDEYAVFALLAVFAALAGLATLYEAGHDEREAHSRAQAHARAQAWVLRIGLSATLGFAALHKLNADFLDPTLSCAGLASRLGVIWAVPVFAVPPWLIIALEAGAIPLLWLWPRLGALWVLVLAAGLGHIGPAAFNTLILAGAVAFLPERDAETLRATLRRGWPALLVAVAALAWLSLRSYQGAIPWRIFAVFQAVLVLVAIMVVAALIHDRGAGVRERLRPTMVEPPTGSLARRLLLVQLVVILALGISPYLGSRYRYGFAMLSNLRVDDARWNSVVVPRAVRLAAHDQYVHVLRVEPPIPQAKRGPPVLTPGVYAPQEFRRRFEASLRQGRRAAIELEYQGRRWTSPGLTVDLELISFARSLPDRPLLQPVLTLDGGQACVH